jgi:predicted metalloprotease with PDZ domain
VTLRHQRFLGGESDPGLVNIGWNDDRLFCYASWQTLVLHELLYLWSAESMRCQAEIEQWFNEGIAEYYACRTAVELGVIDSNDELSILAYPISNY